MLWITKDKAAKLKSHQNLKHIFVLIEGAQLNITVLTAAKLSACELSKFTYLTKLYSYINTSKYKAHTIHRAEAGQLTLSLCIFNT